MVALMPLDKGCVIVAVLAMFAALPFAGCGAAGAVPGKPAYYTSEAGTPARGVVPLSFEAKKPGARSLPFAFVDGKVGERPTRLVIDTGATVHVLDTALAAAAGVALPARASAIAIDGWGQLLEHGVIVRDLPESLRAHGVGVIVSPQLLTEPGQAVVVDFVERQLRMRVRAGAWSELGNIGPVLTAPGTKPCKTSAGDIGGVALLVDAMVDGAAAQLSLDTGSSLTIVDQDSKVGAKVEAHPVLGRSVSPVASGDVPASIHGGVELSIGGLLTTAEVGVAPGARSAQCDHEGRVGLDILQRCALAFTKDQLHVACRAPGPTPAREYY
jgi:hypothetical protein